MFRKTFLATTALVLAAATAAATERGVHRAGIHQRFLNFDASGHVVRGPSATLSVGIAKNTVGAVRNNISYPAPGAMFSNFSKDRNAEFLSWYGFRALNSTYSSFYSQYTWFKISSVGYNAFAFQGGGKLTTMTFAGFASNPDMKFKGAILSATASGLPGNTLASTSSTTFSDTSLCCTGARTVKFVQGAKRLPNGRYFVAVECASTNCEGGWSVEDADYSGAATDYWFFRWKERGSIQGSSYYYTYSTPWRESTQYPAVGATIIK